MIDAVRDNLYSPLCDVDKSAYFAFVAAVSVRDGYGEDVVRLLESGCLLGGATRRHPLFQGGVDCDYLYEAGGVNKSHEGVKMLEDVGQCGVRSFGVQCDFVGSTLGVTPSSDVLSSDGECSSGCHDDEESSRGPGGSSEVESGTRCTGEPGVSSFDGGCDGGVSACSEKCDVGVSDDAKIVEVGLVGGKRLAYNRRKRESKRRRRALRATQDDDIVDSNMQRAVADSFLKLQLEKNTKLLAATDLDEELSKSKKKKWLAQNELAAVEAARKMEILNLLDVAEEAKRRATAVRAGIERNMVSIEKTHATLAATGNDPAVFHGYAETQTSAGTDSNGGVKSGTISPNSSISEAEVRAMQKQILDMELSLTKYRQATGLSLAAIESFQKRVWTDTPENHAILEELYPMGYGIDTIGFPDGKFRPT